MRRTVRARSILAWLFAVALLAAPAGAHAGAHVDIGINLPGPPVLAPVPGTPILYAPDVPANFFFYAGQYYAFVNGVWYVGSGYGGPWVAVAPAFVPRPILAVPVAYYHVRPPAWRRWRREAPPRWDLGRGRHWDERGADHRGDRG